MAELFNNRPGIVTVVDTNSGDDNPFRLTIDGFPESGATGGVILTELAIQRAGNYQFMHTLVDLVYVYSFGERIGQLRANGIAFARLCNGSQGLGTVLAYYEANRLENQPDPISIAIGTGTDGRFRGFLTEINVDVTRPESMLAQFGLQFHSLPSAKPKAPPTFDTGGGGLGGAPGMGSPGGIF
jgi:hypothetical protein